MTTSTSFSPDDDDDDARGAVLPLDRERLPVLFPFFMGDDARVVAPRVVVVLATAPQHRRLSIVSSSFNNIKSLFVRV